MPRVAAAALVVFALLYVLVIASPPDEFGGGDWRTTNTGSAVDDPSSFLTTLLDGITFAGLLFIVGERVLAHLRAHARREHGARGLLPPRRLRRLRDPAVDDGSGFGLSPTEVSTWEWVVPWLVAMACIGVFGLAVQQVLLRWNQGQDLRQALITIAVSVIVADQVIAHFPRTVPTGTQQFGGNAVSITWPGWTNRLVDLHVRRRRATRSRGWSMLALGVMVGVALWLWLHRTKTGMVIRAGVDDRQMTSALGINIQ